MSYPFISKFNYAAVRKDEIAGRTTVERVFTKISENQTDFGFKDKKGRAIGARTALLELRFVEVEVPAHHCHCYVADNAILGELFYAVDVSAQRAGEDYGAGQNYQLFATKAEAEAYIAKYLKDAAKRAAKREGK